MEDGEDLIDIFIEEAREHLPIIEASLLALERNNQDPATLNQLFRSVHTIKGGAGFFGLTNISSLAHSMESLLSLARSHKLVLTDSHIDVLLASQDRLAQMINDPHNSNSINIDAEWQLLNQLIENPSPYTVPASTILPASQNTVENEPFDTEAKFDNTKNIASEEFDNPIVPTLPLKNNNIKHSESLENFITDAGQYLSIIETSLLSLEVHPGNVLQLDELYRSIQAIQNEASLLGLKKTAQLSQLMAEVLDLARNAQLVLEGKYVDTLLEAHDTLQQLLTQRETDDLKDISHICQCLADIQVAESAETPDFMPPQTVNDSPVPAATEVESNANKLLYLELTAPVEIARESNIEEIVAKTVHNSEGEESIRVHVKRLNKLIDLAGELVLVRNQVFRLSESLIPATPGLKAVLHNFNRITTEMQEEIMSTRMQPIGVIFNKFPRLIRQLEKDLGKQIELVTEGADVELDKTIIESLADPVTHIIRNMADHGIEAPSDRIAKGKPASGTILQKAFHESGQVVIQFSDDGKGIEPDFIANNAVEKGIITAAAMDKMTAKEKMSLIFTPGFSTAKTLSSVSGRGIGMDVVKTNIEQIGGTIDVSSQSGKWTTITMTLPLTMAIISALIVSANRCRFAFPQGNLEEMVLLEPEDYDKKVGEVHGQRMLSLRGSFLPLISLAESLNMTKEDQATELNAADKFLYILIIKAEQNRVAVIVDQILGSEEIVVKPMPEYFRHLKNFSGTSILGDGAIAMIIDVQGYIQKNQLNYTELQRDSDAFDQRCVEQEPQSLLIFDNNTEEHFALALSWIRRIDSLDVRRIQIIAGNEYIEYRGEQMRLLRLEQCLPVQKPNNYQAVANIIIPKRTKVPVALLINKVIDTKNAVLKLENASVKAPGILGSMLIDGKITLMLDLYNILEKGEPDSVEKIEINSEKAKSKRILLVEDTPFFMKIIKECVVSAGYQVTTATNGCEGLEVLQKQDFDLVLSDIEMPVMDGREMVKNIRTNPRWNNMPVIALTTLNDEQTVAEGKKAGFNEWLVKLDKELVLKTLASYL